MFVGPLPEGYKPSSKWISLDKKAVEEHRENRTMVVYDDISMEVNTALPDSYATFARGKAIGLLTKESLQGMIRSGYTSDPFNREKQLDPTIIAWVFENKEGPFFPEAVLPIAQTDDPEKPEKLINMINCGDEYLAVITTYGVCYIYNKDYTLVETLQLQDDANEVVISEDDIYMYVVTYNSDLNKSLPPKLYYIPKDDANTQIKQPTVLNDPIGEGGTYVKTAFFIGNNVFVVFSPNRIYQRNIKEKTGEKKSTTISRAKLVKFGNDNFHIQSDRDNIFEFYYRNDILFVYNKIIGWLTKYRYEEGIFNKVMDSLNLVEQKSTFAPTVSVSGKYLATPCVGQKMRVYNIIEDISSSVNYTYESRTVRSIYNVTSIAVSDQYMVYNYKDVITVVDLADKREVQKIRIKDAVGERRLEKIRVVLFKGKLIVGYDEAMMIFEERK